MQKNIVAKEVCPLRILYLLQTGVKNIQTFRLFAFISVSNYIETILKIK